MSHTMPLKTFFYKIQDHLYNRIAFKSNSQWFQENKVLWVQSEYSTIVSGIKKIHFFEKLLFL